MEFSVGDRIVFDGFLGTYTILAINLEEGTIEHDFGAPGPQSFEDFYADSPQLLSEVNPPPMKPEIGGTRDRAE